MNLGKIPHHPNQKYAIPLPDGVPKPPILGLYIGKRGSGKSTAAVRLLHYYLEHRPQVFNKDLTYVISPTADSQYHLWDFMGIPRENIFTCSTSAAVKNAIDGIITTLTKRKEEFDLDIAYLEAYTKLLTKKNAGKLTPREITLLESRDFREPVDPVYPRPCLMLDDLSHLRVLDSNWFISLCLRHRHIANGVSLSMIMICQSLRGGVSRVIRQNASLIVLFATHSKDNREDLYEECNHLLTKEEFMAIFEDATSDLHSYLALDLTQKDPNLAFSKNLEHHYEIVGEIPPPEISKSEPPASSSAVEVKDIKDNKNWEKKNIKKQKKNKKV